MANRLHQHQPAPGAACVSRRDAVRARGTVGLLGVAIAVVAALLAGCAGSGSAPTDNPGRTAPTTSIDLVPRSEQDPAIDVTRSGYQPPEVPAGLAVRDVYAAFGDSISAGIGSGVFGYCGRTDGSWVAYLARRDGAEFLNYACVGAQLADLEEQAETLDPVVDVVGVTLLGNDIGVAKVLADCVAEDCRIVLDAAINKARTLLPRAERVLRRLGEGRKLVVAGYASSFSPEHVCTGPLDVADYRELHRAFGELAELLEETVGRLQDDGFDAVFVQPDVTGHELCTPDPWFFPLGAVGALHPTAAGQQAAAAAVPVFTTP